MTALKRILTLDLATVTGFALGPAGTVERSGSVRLKRPKDDTEVAWENVGFFLRDLFVLDVPDVIVAEAPLPAGATPGGRSTVVSWGLLAVARSVAAFYEVPVRYGRIQDVRQHYTGRRSWEPPADFKPNLARPEDRRRAYGKSKVIERAHALGHMPTDCFDDNRADACALFAFASERMFATPMQRKLVLFGERPPA